MSITIRIPATLQQFTKTSHVAADGETIRALFDCLDKRYPGIKDMLFSKGDCLHQFINVYVNNEDIRFLEKCDTPLKDGDTVLIIPAIAGG